MWNLSGKTGGKLPRPKEMVVDGSALNYILQTDTDAKVQVSIPGIGFFTMGCMNDTQEEVNKSHLVSKLESGTAKMP